MKFGFRLAYYAAGFAMGLVFLFFILNGKEASCSYFPNDRVLKHLRSKPFVYTDKGLADMKTTAVDTADVKKILTYGDVDFDKSKIESGTGKLYYIEGRNSKNQPVIVEIANLTSRAELRSIQLIK